MKKKMMLCCTILIVICSSSVLMATEVPEQAAGLIQYAGGAYSYWTDFLFQGMFAATAATIISGAVAERIKLSSFLIFVSELENCIRIRTGEVGKRAIG